MKNFQFLWITLGVTIGFGIAFALQEAMHPIADAMYQTGIIPVALSGYGPAKEIGQGCGITIHPNDQLGPITFINEGANAEGAIVLSETDQNGKKITVDQVWEGANYWQYGTRFVVRGSTIWYLESLNGAYRPDDPTCQ